MKLLSNLTNLVKDCSAIVNLSMRARSIIFADKAKVIVSVVDGKLEDLANVVSSKRKELELAKQHDLAEKDQDL